MFVHIFGEFLSLLFPFGVSLFITKYLAFAPLLPASVKNPEILLFLPKNVVDFLKTNNDIAISIIPSLIYLIGRIYFESMLLVRSLIPNATIGKYLFSFLSISFSHGHIRNL